MQEKWHNQWIHTNIWKGNNHIISMTWCSHIKMFPPIRRHRIKIQQVIKMTLSQECSLLRVDPVHTFCHHTTSIKSTINDTTFSSGIIKKRYKKESKIKHPSCFSCKLYCLIPNPRHNFMKSLSDLTQKSKKLIHHNQLTYATW